MVKVSIDGVRVGDYNISPSPSVRNLGTWFDPHLDMDVHITKTCSRISVSDELVFRCYFWISTS